MKKAKKTKTKKPSKPVKNKNPKPKESVLPLGDRVLVKPIDVEEMNTTASGIIIPDTVSKEKPEQGIVVAIGKKVDSDLNIGDRVVFSRYGFDEVKVKGVEYYILKEENILAVIN